MVPLLLSMALLYGQAAGVPSPAAETTASSVRDQGAVRSLNFVLGESVVITLDVDFKPVLQSATLADAETVAARLPAPIDLQTPETPNSMPVYGQNGDSKKLNRAAPGTILLTLVPYQTGTMLYIDNGLDAPFRYHAATMQPVAGSGASGSSTTLCPAKPGVGTVETWAARFASLLIVKIEPSAPGDASCRM